MGIKTICTWIIVFQISGICGSHFRGGSIMWIPGSKENEIVITFKIAWRRSYSHNTFCDADVLQSNKLIGVGNMVEFNYHPNTVIGSMSFFCTDFSDSEDWTQGENTFNYTFTGTQLVHNFGFAGTAWITLSKGGGGEWKLKTSADLTVRNDTWRINSSPVTTMQPIVRLQHGCNSTIQVPVNDADGDIVRCRWCKDASECGSIYSSLMGYIDQDTCILTYNAASYNTGYYAVALQLEDFESVNSTEPLSSVPLQFLVLVTESSTQCLIEPSFVSPTPKNGACIGVPFGKSLSETIVARVEKSSSRIVEITTSSPIGMTKSELSPFGSTSNEWFVNITWTPSTTSESRVNLFCFTATDDRGLSSDQRCINLVGGVTPPEIVRSAVWPTGEIYPTHTTWILPFDQMVVRPTMPTYIYFYKGNGTLHHEIDVSRNNDVSYLQDEEDKWKIQITTRFRLDEKETYYILTDQGIAKSQTYCGVESYAITDSSFWNVTIRDITPPVLSFVENPSITNGTATFSWTSNEEVTTRCLIQSPSSSELISCNSAWTGENLHEGLYTILVQGTDLTSNVGKEIIHTWRVDRTPPVVSFISKPTNITNDRRINIIFKCNEICHTVCRLIKENHSEAFSVCQKRYLSQELEGNSTYIFEVQATDSVGNQAKVESVSWTTDFTPPTFDSFPSRITINCDNENELNNIMYPKVTDNMDLVPALTYNDTFSGNCEFSRKWTVKDFAGNNASAVQTVKFITTRPPNVTFPEDILIACGELEDATNEVMIPSLQSSHPCHIPLRLRYIDPPLASSCGVTFNRTWEVINECGQNIYGRQVIKILHLQFPISPQNGEREMDLFTILRWPEYPGSLFYNVYVWKLGDSKTESPISGTYSNTFRPTQPYLAGTKYLWQIEYILENGQIIYGPRWGFETTNLPDLSVETITIPSVAFSGQSFEVKWMVKNIGNRTTTSLYWYDTVYISFVNEISQSRRVATVRQNHILYPKDVYTALAKVQLKEDEIGTLYLYVQTDYYKQVSEIKEENNLKEARGSVNVKLTPPPDLRIEFVNIPTSTYSGRNIQVHYTVSNVGVGSTGVHNWYDCIVWSEDKFYNDSDTTLAYIHRNSFLGPMDIYNVTRLVAVPKFIYGQFYIIVITDVFHKVFEYNMEKNNVKSSENPLEVILTPPPDLSVVSLNVESSFRTGDSVYVSWVVENIGHRAPYANTWYDKLAVYSNEFSMQFQRQVFLNLKPSESYEIKQEVLITSDFPTGVFNMTVTADDGGSVFEYETRSNNMKTTEISIVQELPDLSVSNIAFNMESSHSSNILFVTWEVYNNGPGRTVDSVWVDKVAVVAAMDGNNALKKEKYHYVPNDKHLDRNEKYMSNATLSLPPEVYGNLTISIASDIYRQLPDSDWQNNYLVFKSSVFVPLLAPDLAVEKCHVQSDNEVYSGGNIKIEYVVVNLGINVTSSSTWVDVISLNDYRDTSNFVIAEEKVAGPLKTGQKYSRTITIMIPESLAGNVFYRCTTNARKSIFEGNRYVSNSQTHQVYVSTPPSPDLQISNYHFRIIQYNDSPQALLSAYWEVSNTGNSLWNKTEWTDAIAITYIDDQLFVSTYIDTYTIATFKQSATLESSLSYIMNKTVPIPQRIKGNVFVYVMTDSQNNIPEIAAESNNIVRSIHPITITDAPSSNVTVVHVNVSSRDISRSSSRLPISFTVMNVGKKTSGNSWNDDIFVSNLDTTDAEVILRNGILSATMNHIGALVPGGSYTVNTDIKLPRGITGDLFVYVFTNTVNHEHFSENVQHSQFSKSQSFIVSETNKPNLLIGIERNKTKLRGGQPVVVNYTILNNGDTEITQSFFITFSLSDDIDLDPFDQKLKVEKIQSSILINGSLDLSTKIFIPYDLEAKTYFMILYIDSRDDIDESNEDDNLFWRPFVISTEISTDIAVLDVIAPHEIHDNQQIKVSWMLGNNGSKAASGYRCDSVYLSKDTNWDIGDEQIGETICGDIDIDPKHDGQDYVFYHIEAKVPPVIDSEYNAIVKTRTNILDTNLQNNIGYAENTTTVLIDILPLSLEKQVSLGLEVSHQFRIPDVPSEETLVIKTKGHTKDSFNRVYVKFGKPATRYSFDQTVTNPIDTEHTITMANTKEGDYYVLLELSKTTYKETYVNISAVIAKFEIQSTFPESAAPIGNVTIKIQGTLFPEDIVAKLFNETVTLNALKTYWFSSTLFYATFDIKHLRVGCNISLELFSKRLGESIILPSALNVIRGTSGKVSASILSPGTLVSGRKDLITVNVQNDGQTDINAPFISVTINSNGLIKLLSNSKETHFIQSYLLVSGSAEGPSGILLPGENRRFIFETKQNDENTLGISEIDVSVVQPVKTREHVFMRMYSVFQPSEYSDNIWNKTWNNFQKSVGTSWYALSHKASDVLNQFSLAGQTVDELIDVIRFLLKESDGLYKEGYLTASTDLETDQELNLDVQLTMTRYMPYRVGQMELDGPLGKGWILPLWDTRLKNVSSYVIQVTIERRDFLFFASGFGTYTNPEIGQLYVETDDVRFVDKNSGIHYIFNMTTGLLMNVKSKKDNSNIVALYNEDGQLDQLKHNSGSYMEFSYDENGRISSVMLRKDTKRDLCIYWYDNDNNCLTSVQCNGKTRQYTYSDDGILQTVRDLSGLSYTFTYTNEGFVESKITHNGDVTIQNENFRQKSGKLTVTKWPDNTKVDFYFNVNGKICAIKMAATPILRTIQTKSTTSLYQGDTLYGGSQCLIVGGEPGYNVPGKTPPAFRKKTKEYNIMINIITKKQFDKTRNRVRLEDGNGESVEIGYNSHGKVQYYSDSNGNQYTIRRFANDSLRYVNYPDGSYERYSYLKNGFIKTTRNNARKVTLLDEKQRIVYKDDGQQNISVFQYNNNDSLSKVHNTNCDIEFTYNHNSLPQSVKYNNNTEVKYSYGRGNIKAGIAIDKTNYDIHYEYDSHNRLTNVLNKGDGMNLLNVVYNEKGKIKRKTSGNGAYTKYSYDPDTNLLKGIYNFLPNGTIATKFEYLYDFRQRRVSLETMQGTWAFRYDPSGQVTYMRHPDGNETHFSYDAGKNRKYKMVNGKKQYYSTNVLNQYTTYQDKQQILYDKNGNLVSKGGKRPRTYRFNEDNHLAEYETSDSKCMLKYDPLGNLYKKDCVGYSSTYVIDQFGKDGSDILTEEFRNGSEIKKTFYFYGGDQLGLIAMKNDDGYYFYQFDPLGSVVSVLSESGDIINSYSYDPFGEAFHSLETISNSFTFVGQWGVMKMSEVDELYFMRTRFYDAELGRFLSVDTLGINGGSKNFYTYVDNNPVHFNDPNGKFIPVLLVSAAKDLIMYGVTSYISGEEMTLGGATAAVVTGLLSGPLGSAGSKLLGKVGAKLLGKIGNTEAGRIILGQAAKYGEKIVDTLSKVSPKLPGLLEKFGKNLGTAIRDDIIKNVFTEGDISDIDLSKDFVDSLIKTLPKPVQKAIDGIKVFLHRDEIEAGLKDLIQRIKSDVQELTGEAIDALDKLSSTVNEGINDLKNALNELGYDIKEFGNDILNKAYDDLNALGNSIKDFLDGVKNDIGNAISDLADKANSILNNIRNLLNNLAKGALSWVRSHDPNDIIGPPGYGAARFISPKLNLNYKVRFENEANATAPAQRVYIEVILDNNLDSRSLMLGMIGFGNYTRDFEFQQSFIQESINMTDRYGVFVRIRGGLDIVNNKVTWEFQTLDPQTGFAPKDPTIGFLPPNNGTTGQGFVSFSIRPKKDIPNLSKIEAKAAIYFDQNEPIDTPTIFNTIDSIPPEVNISVIQETLSSGILALSIAKTDHESGTAYVDFFLYSENGYEALFTGVNESMVTFPLSSGQTYQILPVGVDHVGNRITDVMQPTEIYFPAVRGSCPENCSGHGICTDLSTCICDIGFYGSICSEDEPPLEPPVLEYFSTNQTSSTITIYVMIHNGGRVSPDNMFVILTGYPEGSSFDKGLGQGQQWIINATDLGYIIFTPTVNSSEIMLGIDAFSVKGRTKRSRMESLRLLIDSDYKAYTHDFNEGNLTIKPTEVTTSPKTPVTNSVDSRDKWIVGVIGGSFGGVLVLVVSIVVLNIYCRQQKKITYLQTPSRSSYNDYRLDTRF